MRKWFRNLLFAVIILGFVCLSSCDDGSVSPRDPGGSSFQPSYRPQMRLSIPDSMLADNAGKLTTLYCLMGANYKQVPEYIRQNRAAFENTQSLYQCAERFRSLAMQEMLRAPSPSEIREGVYNVAGSDPTLLSHADNVASDMSSSLAETVRLANYIARIGNCVPSVLQGNDEPYYNIDIVQLLSIADPYLLNEYRAFLFNCSYPLIYPLVSMACN